jgi:hypothetical protein
MIGIFLDLQFFLAHFREGQLVADPDAPLRFLLQAGVFGSQPSIFCMDSCIFQNSHCLDKLFAA